MRRMRCLVLPGGAPMRARCGCRMSAEQKRPSTCLCLCSCVRVCVKEGKDKENRRGTTEVSSIRSFRWMGGVLIDRERGGQQRLTDLGAGAVQRQGRVHVVVLGDEERRHFPTRVALLRLIQPAIRFAIC